MFRSLTAAGFWVLLVCLGFTTPLTANRGLWFAVRWSLGGGAASTRSEGDCAQRTDDSSACSSNAVESMFRNNSELPVDHSGPGLRVGPTTPPPVGQKPEACPPDFDGVGVGVAVDLAVEGAHSQRKSGRESESGALSGASEANDVLRSAATQRGSSLVLNQSNRYENASNELQARGRKRYCGSRTFRGLLPYEEIDGSRSTLEISTFELRHGRRKFHAYNKKAVRSDL